MSFDPITQPLDGAFSIEASAGTGKTWSITGLWLRLVLEGGLRTDQILVTTFTKAATAELQERLLGGLRQARLALDGGAAEDPGRRVVAALRARHGEADLRSAIEAALSSFDLAPVVTIHGFCMALITRHALELGCDPDLALASSADAPLRDIIGDLVVQRAAREALDADLARRVGRAVAANHLAALTPPMEAQEVERCAAAVRALLPLLERPAIKGPTRTALRRRLELETSDGLSDAMWAALGDDAGRVEAALARYRKAKAAGDRAAYHSCAEAVRSRLPERLARAGMRTFDDILLTVHRALVSGQGALAAAVRERFRAVIVDECQDSDEVQIAVFRRLFLDPRGDRPAPGVSSFFIIGDPKQSIYRFRGADLASYRTLAGCLARTADLTVNWRSDAPLVQALNDLYRPRPEFAGGGTGAPIRYVAVSSQRPPRLTDPGRSQPLLVQWSEAVSRPAAKRDLARRIAVEFRRLLDQAEIIDAATDRPRRLRAGDLAVLATSHDQLLVVRQALQAEGIPSQLAGQSLGSVWASDEALDMLAWCDALDAVARNADPLPSLLALGATPLGGLDLAEIERLREDAVGQAAACAEVRRELAEIQREGPLPVLVRRIGRPALQRMVLGHADGERRATNWRQIAALLQRAWLDGQRQVGHLRRWLTRRLADQRAGDDEADLARLETDRPAVVLATVHAAKGLEWPVVACPFLWQVKSRRSRAKAPVALIRTAQGSRIDVASPDFDDHLATAMAQEDEEQQRLLYVALTRARHRLYLGLAPVGGSGGHDNGAERSALAALLGLDELPPDQWRDRLPLPVAAPLTPAAAVPAGSADAAGGADLAAPPVHHARHHRLDRWGSYSGIAPHAVADDDGWARDHEDEPRQPGDPGLLRGLGGGTGLGHRLHGVLEAVLGNGRGIDEATRQAADLRPALEAILAADLPLGAAPALRLGDVRDRGIAEMHVLMPVRAIAPADLARALLADPWIAGDPERREWAEGIAGWGFSDLHGYLQGYIDLVLPHAGRWYVLDYKTTILRDYAPATLDEGMRHHQYLLQAWIYALALHRHLARSLPDYDYDRHLGGSAFLFVRGLPQAGTWFRKPARASIAALEDLLFPAEVRP